MSDVAEQIRAWADAAAPVDAVPSSRSAEVAALADRARRRRPPRLLAAAAVTVFVAALAGLLLTLDHDGPQSVTTGPAESTVDAEPVTFDVLAVTDGSDLNSLGVLRAAASPTQLAGLWEVVGADGAAPTVDFGEQVVVSITVPDDACPPTLVAFDRDGSTVSPRFVEPGGGCDGPLIPRTFVAALDRSTTGPAFRLVLPGQPQYEFGETFLDVGGEVPGVYGATAAFHLSDDTMATGSTIAGTVQVYNYADEVLEASTCGAYFVVVLEGEAATQLYSRPRCLERFVVPLGISSYPVTAKATFLTCINGEGSELVPACLPDGSMPTLPPGTYEARIVQPDDAIPVSGPITVTVT
ncbi:MAG: hypothetical protein JNK12_19765 [Acidimicrobiales bacterium]|nr:hypothetical protein [Acidimicrobiales bacterium]